ncbi:collagenase [Streptomyces sp. NBC_00237]|uniref:collagenase n=1 Tax=Streptomyces sp. NBC_00237 TaxID=2975687 RepID=UPI00225AD203|nr:collagenase [Streptomyces sp. NBC_00237]MCX5203584.1 collagenase [Streptomyces sp. NBC_00237]
MPRRILLAATLSTALVVPVIQSAQAAPLPSATNAFSDAARQPQPRAAQADVNPFDEVERLATAPKSESAIPAPQAITKEGRIPGAQTKALPAAERSSAQRSLRAAGVPCTLDGITRLGPEQFADFLADPAVTADGCMRDLIWTWDARLAPVMSDAHVQAVARRISSLAPNHDGKNTTHLYEMFTYLHAVAYHDFSRDEIDTTDTPTVETVRRAINDFGTAARTFDVTKTNANTLREALYAAGPGLRHSQLGLIRKVLATMDQYHNTQYADPAWGGAALAALSTNYLGVYPGNKDTAFHTVVKENAAYRESFKKFAGYTHLKGTPNEWVVRDALSEYGRFGQIDGLKDSIVADLGPLLATTKQNFGDGSAPWAKVASWLNTYEACKPYGVCKEDIEKRIFPYTYTYDNGAIKVRTGLDRATVDQLYYASKQVKAQFHRVIGSTEPIAGDTNTTLNTVLYASRADYENYHPLLTGMATNNGGVYIEKGATFYTYQRRVPQDSQLTLEELFRHEYVHYLNGRFAVHGSFGQGPWYQNDRTTAMDEGTGEFFDGATREDGIAVRKSLVKSIIADTSRGGPRMTVNQLLHATYNGDGFRFYPYAGTFFEYLWRDHPGKLQEMYKHLRANDVAAYDAWRKQQGSDVNLQRGYDAFLDQQIAIVDQLFVPNTQYTPNGSLKFASAADVKAAFKTATYIDPAACKDDGGKELGRFTCTGRITANLSNSADPSKVFKDVSETVDYYLLDRSKPAANNFGDMNCSFGKVDVWSTGQAGTTDFVCEGPLRR